MPWPPTTSTLAAASRCRLLELPAEIRDAIYRFALTAEKPVVTFRLDDYQRDSYEQAVQPALTQVSRQVRQESLPVYFASNTFVLHTEGSKADDARRWLQCNEWHLPKLLMSVSLWFRYVSLTNDRAASHGALGVSLSRLAKDVHWTVEDGFKWITVMRQPSGLERDAAFLARHLRSLLSDAPTACMDAQGFSDLMSTLRTMYVERKVQ